ncbi:MAG: hypothetical protein HWN67_17440 [Candidatus Helarchaeota archaeon]|nr:hypothetical protein [Candidatus Helarchaeota archaeon]
MTVKEKDYGVWSKKKRKFKLSIGLVERNKVYECFKLFFDMNEEELMLNSKKLVDIVMKTCNIANNYGKHIINDLSKNKTKV